MSGEVRQRRGSPEKDDEDELLPQLEEFLRDLEAMEHADISGDVARISAPTLLLGAEGFFDAVVCVGTPLRLRQPGIGLVRYLKHVVPAIPKKAGSDIRDPAARARHPSLRSMPLASIHELQKLQDCVLEALPRIEVPLLVAYGAFDATAHPEDARAIAAGVGSRVVECRLYERSSHVVPVDYDGSELAEAAARFLLDSSATNSVCSGDCQRLSGPSRIPPDLNQGHGGEHGRSAECGDQAASHQAQ